MFVCRVSGGAYAGLMFVTHFQIRVWYGGFWLVNCADECRSLRINTLRYSLLSCLTAVLCLIAGAASHAQVPDSRERMALSFAPLVKKTAPAVVNIYTRTRVVQRNASPLFNDPFFRRFFGEQFGLRLGQPRERTQNSLGSGVIVDAGGIIVTNNHVIDGADEIRVVLPDRREFDAELVGADARTDLAVLRIDSGTAALPVVPLHNSDHLEVGDLVLAIGNPFGVGQTVTGGIVSALARTRVGVSDVGSFIQTDAAINPGNSGGALVDMNGGLVGINTAIFSKSGGSLGIGFAVPSNMVKFVIEGLQNGGRVVRPWLGAWGQGVSSDMAGLLGLDRPRGVLVNGVWKGGAADRAEIAVGDVILGVNGWDVNDPRELEFRVAALPIGGETKLSILRPPGVTTVAVALEAAPDVPARDHTHIQGRNPLTGASILNFNPAVAEELQLDRFKPGVLITKVRRGSPAARLGFRPGDRLTVMNGLKIGSVANVKSLIESAADAWSIEIDRNGKHFSLSVEQ